MQNVFKRQLFNFATCLKQEFGIDYSTCKVEVLADGYCKAIDEQDEHLKDLFSSGLMLRFWYTIKKMYDKTSTANFGTYDDYVSKLFECINIACAKENRAWQNPDKKTTAQACINQAIATRGVAEIMYSSNLAKHKINCNAVSLDQTVNMKDDDEVTLLDTFEDEDETERMKYDRASMDVRAFIQHYIDKSKLVEAIILDNIAFGDSMKETKTVSKYTDEEGEEQKCVSYKHEFWRFKCKQSLVDLSLDYLNYFFTNYNIMKPEALQAAFHAIKQANDNKLYRMIDKTLSECRTTYKR